MKKILYILALAAISLTATVSCSKNFEWNDPLDSQEAFTLRFAASAMTKADVDGTDRENYVGSLQFFVFPVDATGKVADNTEYIFSATYASDAEGWTYSAASEATENTPAQKEKWTFSLTKAQIATLFPVGTTQVKVFAVANYTVPAEKKTWKDINGIEVGATFTKDGGPGYGKRWPRVMQPDDENLYFIMTGQADVELGDAEKKILLARLASKVTVSFEYETVEDTKGVVWKPQPAHDETRVYLSNAICTTTLGGPLTRTLNPDGGTETAPSANRDVFEYAYDFMNNVPVVDEKPTAHYYTYPVQLAVGDDNQPYLKLVLLWYGYKTINGEEVFYKQKEVYYKIALPSASIDEPNHIYEYNVKVNIIGSDKEVLLTPDYVVKDWTTRDPISANVATGRYISLEIPKDEYDMYVDELDLNFVSSGTVEVIVDEIYQENYSSASGMTKDYFMQDTVVVANNDLRERKGIAQGDAGNNVIKGWVTIPENSSYLKINHEMDNRMTINNQPNEAFDMAPYVFKVTLHLKEAGSDDSFDRHITITQYPALFVSNRYSAGYVFINGYTNDDRTDDYGYSNPCYDDRGRNYNYHLGNIANARGSLDGTGDNNNPNNYIITASILPDTPILPNNGKAILGDPRNPKVDNLTNLSGLTNYHPTLQTGTKATIAPKFIVASSYSALQTGNYGSYAVNKATAEKRCAAYQENGYPAGRWRVPTAAEIMFMAKLSKYGFIPSLFNFTNTSAGYWSANGKVNGSGSGEPTLDENDTTSGGGLRCVYDAWYWGEEPVQETLTEWKGFYDNK